MPETDADRMTWDQEIPPKIASHLPLSALLSHVLVAFTIEFDNEFEHQMPHRTTKHGATADSRNAPWLVSLVMWSNCMQFVSEEGITIGELQRLARTRTNLDGLRRWGYIFIEPDSTDRQSKRLRSDAVVRPTRAGYKAQKVWRPLFDLIEERWKERSGKDKINQLREALWIVAKQLDSELPDCLPILGHGLFSREHSSGDDWLLRASAENIRQAQAGHKDDDAFRLPLSTLLSRVLLAFAIEFEHESDISLAISANLLRILDEQGVQIRDLPRLSGISKEAISMAMGILQKRDLAVVEPDPAGSRFNVVRLTPKGRKARDAFHRGLSIIEERWQSRFGPDAMSKLQESLESLVGEPDAQPSPLLKGLAPYPEGWRASVHRLNTLPHYPMVLHRGGFPDGS